MDGPDAESGQMVHVVFPLEAESDGWPPVSGERVWALRLAGDEYRLENAPWFVRGVAEGDVVRAVAPTDDEWPVYQETVRWSGNCTIRIIPLQGTQDEVLDLFTPFGVTGETAGTYRIVALTVPPEADLHAVKALLAAGEAEGRWEHEEGCVSEAWLALYPSG